MTVMLQRFDDTNPLNLTDINANFQALVAAVNTLAGSNVLQLSAVVDDSPEYMPKTGGTFSGQIAAPSILLAGQPVVKQSDYATTVLRGLVMKANAVADIASAISSPPTQAEVTAIKTTVNALLASMRAAAQLA